MAIIFRLLDRQTDPGSHFLNADGTEDHTRKLDFTNTYGILNPYFIVNQNGVREYRRYLLGCGFFDPAEQDKQKYVVNKANMLLEFKAGAEIVLDPVKGKVLIDFLKDHPLNTKSPYHDKDVHEAVFETYDPAAETRKEAAIAREEDQARIMLYELQANPERMRAVASLFAETAGLKEDEELYLGLRAIANTQPKVFIDSIGSREKQVLSDILMAERLNVLTLDAKAWIFMADESQILPVNTSNRKDATQELVLFLMSEQGDIFYREILVRKEIKEIEENAPRGKMPGDKEVDDLEEKIENIKISASKRKVT